MTKDTRKILYQALTFGITFFTYVSIHSCRSTWSYAKPELQQKEGMRVESLGYIDFCFLFCYSLGSYLLGWLGDKMNLKYYLMISTIGSSLVFSCLAWPSLLIEDGFSGESMYVLQMVNGMLQAMAWPGLIAVMGNWVSPDDRGQMMGIWSGNANLGNIIGYQVGSLTIDIYHIGWQWCLLIAAFFQLFMALLIFIFLAPYPNKKGIQILQVRKSQLQLQHQHPQELLPKQEELIEQKHLTFKDYLMIPGVLRYCVGYLGVKSSTYGILFWLPDYLKSQGVGDQTSTISQVYEMSQFLGGFLVGAVCDRLLRGRKSIVLPFCLTICSLAYFFTKYLADLQHIYLYYIFLVIAGINIGAPYNLISSCITADIGNNSELVNNKSAVSTITSIIEGSGSFGAAVIMIVIPYVQNQLFYLFSSLVLTSAIVFIPLAYKDYLYLKQRQIDTQPLLQ